MSLRGCDLRVHEAGRPVHIQGMEMYNGEEKMSRTNL